MRYHQGALMKRGWVRAVVQPISLKFLKTLNKLLKTLDNLLKMDLKQSVASKSGQRK